MIFDLQDMYTALQRLSKAQNRIKTFMKEHETLTPQERHEHESNIKLAGWAEVATRDRHRILFGRDPEICTAPAIASRLHADHCKAVEGSAEGDEILRQLAEMAGEAGWKRG